ncbi:MAG: thymidine phosphorylase, partial [Rhodobacteraceae bacterium]
MDARAIIAGLRRGETPSADALAWFAQGLADGRVSDAQAGAFAMAVCLRGLGEAGRTALTLAMRDSGDVLTWNSDAPVIDKHSTGGVGDCVSLLLAPALAECGGFVPMISGRGLGHTGGTLDKLDAIPGVVTQVSPDRLRDILGKAGCAIVGASANVAPADKRLYAIRDVTATVESLDLITASILSKKLAAGLQALVLDVKTGSGAFMKTPEEARALARALTDTANAAGCRTSAVITDMNQPLAPALGNALEVAEVMRVLTGEAAGPLVEVTAVLGGVLLADAGLARDSEDGAGKIAATLRDGRAARRFGRMIAAMGGPVGFVEDWRRFLPEANVIREVPSPGDGHVAAIDGEALGLAVVALGGGRQVEADAI